MKRWTALNLSVGRPIFVLLLIRKYFSHKKVKSRSHFERSSDQGSVSQASSGMSGSAILFRFDRVGALAHQATNARIFDAHRRDGAGPDRVLETGPLATSGADGGLVGVQSGDDHWVKIMFGTLVGSGEEPYPQVGKSW